MSKHPLYNQSGLQKDNKSHVLYALVSKKQELDVKIMEYQAILLKAKSDLSALEATICLFDNDCGEIIESIKSIRAKGERNSYFVKGECKKLVLEVLRTSDTPLNTKDISLKIQDIKKISKKDIVLNKKIQKIIVTMLRTLESSNLINQTGKNGLAIIWDIKPLESVS